MTRPYDDDARVVDLHPGDRLEAHCPCGHKVGLAWATLPLWMQQEPLTALRQRLICRRCGKRRPPLTISGMRGKGSEVSEVWRNG